MTDTYLQEQLEKVLKKTLENHKPVVATASNSVRILFNNNAASAKPVEGPSTTSKATDQTNNLQVSYCYPTKEWRCLYRCEIDSSTSNSNTTKVDLSLFGSVNNPTEEDWSQIQLILVANELEILSNNKTTTTPPMLAAERETGSSGSSSSHSSGGMQLFVKTLTGKTITLDVRMIDEMSKFIFAFYRRFLHQILLNRSRLNCKIKKVFHLINNG